MTSEPVGDKKPSLPVSPAHSTSSSAQNRQGAGKRLNDRQRIEVIQLAEQSKISKRQLADRYGVSEAAIRKLLLKKDEFLKRYYETPAEIRDQRLRGKSSKSTMATNENLTAAAAAAYMQMAATSMPPPAPAAPTAASTLLPIDPSFQASAPAPLSVPVPAASVPVPTVIDPLKQGLLGLVPHVAPLLEQFLENKSLQWSHLARVLRDIRRCLHRFPETGYKEVETQAFIKAICIEALKIPSENVREVATTGLIVDVCCGNDRMTESSKRKVPILAFRADMDALPIEEKNADLPYCSVVDGKKSNKKKRSAVTDTSARKRKKPTTDPSEMTAEAAVAIANEISPLPLSTIADTDDQDQEDCSSVPAAAHMCGHDGHMSMVLGLCALVVKQSHLLPTDAFVRFLFQPAEEGPGGAKQMIQDGALNGVDEVYGLHNYPFPLHSIHVSAGPVLAHEVEFSIEITGVGGHGSTPQHCIDPIVVGTSIVQNLQTIVSRTLAPTDTAVVSVTQFHAGDTNNVIPASAKLGGTIRTFDIDRVATTIKAKVQQIVDATAAAYGATASVHFEDGYAPVVNPVESTTLVQQVGLAMGVNVSDAGLPLMASEDFAYYLQARKGCFFFLGTQEEYDHTSTTTRALHSNHFDFNDKAMPIGIRMFVGILQTKLQCQLYSMEGLQAFQVEMERITEQPVNV